MVFVMVFVIVVLVLVSMHSAAADSCREQADRLRMLWRSQRLEAVLRR